MTTTGDHQIKVPCRITYLNRKLAPISETIVAILTTWSVPGATSMMLILSSTATSLSVTQVSHLEKTPPVCIF